MLWHKKKPIIESERIWSNVKEGMGDQSSDNYQNISHDSISPHKPFSCMINFPFEKVSFIRVVFFCGITMHFQWDIFW